jgi:hypothetical protein
MKMDKIAGSWNDEFYTPEYAIKPIIKYLKKWARILCPFDTEKSNFVKILKEEWFDVINTHLENWFDFFNITNKNIENIDYIISNPPYSLKWEVFNKLFELWKPFAMLVWVVWLFESQKRFEMFRDNNFEIMYMNRRVAYFKSYEEQNPSLNPPFSSVYLCSWILPKQIVFEEIFKKYKEILKAACALTPVKMIKLKYYFL